MKKVVLITGSTSGIGKTTALRLAADGFEVIVNGRNPERGKQVVAAIQKSGGSSIFIQTDVTDRQAVSKLFADIKQRYGKLDVLVNNAGGDGGTDNLDNATGQDLLNGFKLNFFSAFYCSQEAVKLMTKGVIINVGSVNGLQETPSGGAYTAPIYSAAKSALHNFSQTLAKTLAPNIRVNTVVPGYTRTPNWGSEQELEADEERLKVEPLIKRFSTAEEIADVIALLVKNESMTGSLVIADGGLTISEERASEKH